MKIVETNDLSEIQSDSQSNIRGRMLNASDTFEFRCHPGVSCFNLCCRNLNLFLNPYDVIRLKQNLGISSSEFIPTSIEMEP